VAEDDDLLWPLLERLINSAGREPSCHSLGEEMLVELRRDIQRIGAVLLDIELPDISGIEILRRIRTVGPSMPVIMISGLSDAESIVLCMQEGADDYLTKPFNPGALDWRLRQALERLLLRMGRSPQITRLAQLAGQVAPTKIAVLIMGRAVPARRCWPAGCTS
jgi:DNA-binding NtrC family response regulator